MRGRSSRATDETQLSSTPGVMSWAWVCSCSTSGTMPQAQPSGRYRWHVRRAGHRIVELVEYEQLQTEEVDQ